MALVKGKVCNLGLQGLIRCSSLGSQDVLAQQRRENSSEVAKSINSTTLRRGTGGRSSFSGVVATVFGCRGFLGSRVVNRLGKIGCQVILPYRCEAYKVVHLKITGDLGQVLFMPFNLKDEESLYKAMKYSNVVINVIGKFNETSNFNFEDVHVTGARNIARIAKECGVKRLIHVSALNAEENPSSVILKKGSKFLASKWRGEQAVREEFPEATIFRPSLMWGEDDTFICQYGSGWRGSLLPSRLPLWNKGIGIIKQPVFVSNVAEGIVNSIFEENALGETYQAVGPKRYEMKELVDWFNRIMLKDDRGGHRVTEMAYSPLFWLKVWAVQKHGIKSPKICWEKLAMEHVQDDLNPLLPTLEDLGVKLREMEDEVPYHLYHYRALNYYSQKLGEFPPAAPPRVVMDEF